MAPSTSRRATAKAGRRPAVKTNSEPVVPGDLDYKNVTLGINTAMAACKEIATLEEYGDDTAESENRVEEGVKKILESSRIIADRFDSQPGDLGPLTEEQGGYLGQIHWWADQMQIRVENQRKKEQGRKEGAPDLLDLVDLDIMQVLRDYARTLQITLPGETIEHEIIMPSVISDPWDYNEDDVTEHKNLAKLMPKIDDSKFKEVSEAAKAKQKEREEAMVMELDE